MKLFALISAASAASKTWPSQCSPDPSVDKATDPEWTTGSWTEQCGSQFSFNPVNMTCSYSPNNFESYKFLGGGAFISGENEFFGVNKLTEEAGDLVVFYANSESYCKYNWWNGTNNAVEGGNYEHADAVIAECTTSEVNCHSLFEAVPGQYYFMETTNDHRQAKVANYNFQFYGADEEITFDIDYYDNNNTATTEKTIQLGNQQYNKKQFNVYIHGSEGRPMNLMNLTCTHCEFDVTCVRDAPAELCNSATGVYKDGDLFATDTGVVSFKTNDQVNTQVYGFSGTQQAGEVQIPNMWKSTITGAPL